jgi:outer membrane protein assembly factor BamB
MRYSLRRGITLVAGIATAAGLALQPAAAAAPTTNWAQWGQNAQHHGFVDTIGQAMNGSLAEVVYDPFVPEEQAANDGELLVHYQAPVIEQDNVFMEFETGTYNPTDSTTRTWHEKRLHWEGNPSELVTKWDFASDWKPPSTDFTGWEAVFHAALSTDFMYVPGAGGTVFKLTKGSGEVIARINPFTSIDPNTFETGPITADDAGNIYYNTISLDPATFALRDSRLVKVTNSGDISSVTYADLLAPANPPGDRTCRGNFRTSYLPWPQGIVPTDPNSQADPNALAPLGNCGAQRVAVNVAPAVAPDGTIYTVTRAHYNSRYGYVVAVNPDLSFKWAASLRDRVNNGCGVTIPIATQSNPIQKGKCRWGAKFGVDPGTNEAPAGRIHDASTSSPTVLPDGSVLYGAWARYNLSRGDLFKFSASGEFLASFDFGWDSTPAVMKHDGTYSIVIKDNHYDEEGGFYCNPSRSVPVSQIVCASTGIPAGPFYITQLSSNLVPEWSFHSTETKSCMRNPDGSLSCTVTNPNGFEWCVNGDVISGNGTVYANSEDGNLYAIPQGHTGVFDMSSPDVKRIFLRSAIGAAYTPTAIGPNGLIYTENDGILFVVGAGGRPSGRPGGHTSPRPSGDRHLETEVTD